MTRQGLTRGFGLTGALALLVTATLHTVATPQINELATSLPGGPHPYVRRLAAVTNWEVIRRIAQRR